MILYKYCKLNDYTKDSLRNSYLYFSPYTDFNDPFEFKFINDLTGTEEQKKTYVAQMLKRQPYYDRLSRQEIEYEINRIINNFPSFNYEAFYGAMKRAMSMFGIYCTSLIGDDILMWSHYADGHKGICLKFNFADEDAPHCTIEEVRYEDRPPIVNRMRDNGQESVFAVLLTKGKKWEYEQEARFLNYKPKEKVTFDAKCLQEITLGCRTSESDIRDIISIVKAGPYNCKLSKANLCDDRYALEVKEIS